MEILSPNCAGLDVQKKTVKVCLLIHMSDGKTRHPSFGPPFPPQKSC